MGAKHRGSQRLLTATAAEEVRQGMGAKRPGSQRVLKHRSRLAKPVWLERAALGRRVWTGVAAEAVAVAAAAVHAPPEWVLAALAAAAAAAEAAAMA